MRWVEYPANTAGREMHIVRDLLGKPDGKKYLKDLDVDGRVL
jgi:hypothetical protein